MARMATLWWMRRPAMSDIKRAVAAFMTHSSTSSGTMLPLIHKESSVRLMMPTFHTNGISL